VSAPKGQIGTLNGAAPAAGNEAHRIAELISTVMGEASRGPLDALRAWRDRLDSILRVVTDGVVVLDFTGSIVFANKAGLELLCVPPESAPWGRSLVSVLSDFEMRDEHQELVTAARFPALLAYAGESVPDTVLCLQKPGRLERWVMVRTSPIHDEQQRILAVTLVFRDATDQKRSEQRLRLLADASGLLGVSLDETATLRAIADFLVERLADACVIQLDRGGRLDDVVAASVPASNEEHWRHLVRRWTISTRRCGPAAVLETRDSELHDRFTDPMLEPVVRGAQVHPASALVCPLVVRGRTLGVLSIFTEQRAPFGAMELLLAAELSGRIAMALENSRLYRESTEASAGKDYLLAMLSHELRNPLAPILSTIERIRLDPMSERLQEQSAVIHRQAQYLSRLLDDLLDLAQLSQGKVQLAADDVALAEVVSHALDSVRPLLEQREHRLAVEIAPKLTVRGDRERLTQIFACLLHNAAKFTPTGGHIEVHAAVRDGQLVATVSDDGQGIRAEVLDRIFQPFVQGELGTSARVGGLGLGLSLVRSLCALHGGSIEARSDGPNRGSDFVVRLPASRVVAVPAAPVASIARPSLTGRKVLVVDDNADAADALADCLDLFGCEVHTVLDGLAAIEMAHNLSADIILLDLGMPGLDGFEVARRIRARLGERPLIVAVSGFGHDEDRQRSKEAGCDGHLVKPVPLHVLRDSLQLQLARKQAGD
jgi:PAS domain S-box-containing protein